MRVTADIPGDHIGWQRVRKSEFRVYTSQLKANRLGGSLGGNLGHMVQGMMSGRVAGGGCGVARMRVHCVRCVYSPFAMRCAS